MCIRDRHAEPHQLADHHAIRKAILVRRPRWKPPRAVSHTDNEQRGLSVTKDGRVVRYIGERLGGNRAVRAEPPLPTRPFNWLRAESRAPDRPDEWRFGVKVGCVVGYFEVTIGESATGRTADGDCIAVGLGSNACLLYTSPSPRDATLSRMPSSA